MALVGASLLLSSLVPSAAGAVAVNQRYVVVFNGGFNANGTYALGRDKCFGYGRIDAYRAVTANTTYVYDRTAPGCTE